MSEFTAKYYDADGNSYRFGFESVQEAITFLERTPGSSDRPGYVMDENGAVVWSEASGGEDE